MFNKTVFKNQHEMGDYSKNLLNQTRPLAMMYEVKNCRFTSKQRAVFMALS